MAIDKIKLRALAKDKDERLFAEGDMLDARNVTMSTDGESSGGIVKNTKGTVPGSAFSDSDQLPNEESRVVGSIADDANGKVYFFVWSTSSSNHGVYQYDVSNDTYKIVLKSPVFSFEKYGFVKADIINGDFRKNETEESLLYFTDGVNPPRKINIHRALEGDFDGYYDSELEHALSLIKAPNLFAPSVALSTESGRTTNNLFGTVLQFAIQYVYKDGESSALSPHSKVVYPKYMSLQGISDTNVAGSTLDENVALVNTRWINDYSTLSEYKKEVSKIRILARTVNTNPFFIVDEFDPSLNIEKNSNTIYDSSSGIYKFYNDGLYLFESGTVTDRIFDDVPHKAAGQAISGNRLMLSSPTSGYKNVDVRATLSVDYEPTPSVAFVSEDSSDALIMHAQNVAGLDAEDGTIKIDLSQLDSTVSANTTVRVYFEYKPTSVWTWGYYDAGGGSTPTENPLYNVSFTLDNGGDVSNRIGQPEDHTQITATSDLGSESNPGPAMGAITCDLSHEGMDWRGFEVNVFVQEATSRADVLTLIKSALEEQVARYSYNDNVDVVTLFLRDTDGDFSYKLLSKEIKFDIAFECSVNGDYIEAQPRAWNFELPAGNLHTGVQGEFVAADEKLRLTTFNSNTVHAGVFNGISENSYFTNTVTAPKYSLTNFPLGSVYDFWFNYDLDYVPTPSPAITNQNDGARGYAMAASQSFSRRSFKAGSTHKFGVVYFDKYGRCGYVNEIGDIYVKPFGDSARNGDNGPCTISVDFQSQPPSWAASYQIVYSDMGSWEKFESFVVGGGFYKEVEGVDMPSQTTTDESKIYLSLNTLTKQQLDKGSLKDYVYTPGDKLRIISYKPLTSTLTGSETYYSSADSDMLNVSGIEVFTTEIEGHDADGNAVHTNHYGKFLAVTTQDGQDITNFTPGGQINYWNHECLVEVLTPRKDPATQVYYEIGESRPIYGAKNLSNPSNNKHNDSQPVVLTEGSVYFGLRSVVTPNVYDNDGFFSVTNTEDFDDDVRIMESMDASDYVASRCWSKGRAHVKYDNAATINYPNRIVYSEEFVDPLQNITFSSFNPGSSSFKDLPRNFGSINYIEEYNQGLVALQENKLSYVPVQRNIIEYADGTSAITANASVLGTHKEANGDFGCGQDQSAVLVRDGMVFFVDKSRQKAMLAAGVQMLSISDIEMSSFIESELNQMEAAAGTGGRIISGYHPEENLYLLTIEPKVNGETTTYAGTTLAYSISDKRWISRYDFKPSNYCSIDNKMLSGYWYQNSGDTESYLFNNHNSSTMNTFYGTSYPTSVKVVSKMSPSEVKVFNAISYEGDSGSYSMLSGATTNLGQTSSYPVVFTEKEGSYYAEFPRSSESKYVFLGDVVSVAENLQDITLENYVRFNKLGLNLNGSAIYYLDSITNTYELYGAVDSFNQETGVIRTVLAQSGSDAEGNGLYVLQSNDADSMRGNWAEIELSNSSTSPHELYCINTHISGSKLHHPLGQQ